MSRSLVKQALSLLEDTREKRATGGSSQARGSTIQKANQAKNERKLNADRRKLKASIRDLQMKCILDEVKRKKNEDRTEYNLWLMEKMNEHEQVEITSVNKILSCQKETPKKCSPSTSKKKEESAFTEDDFKKFEDEYFVRW